MCRSKAAGGHRCSSPSHSPASRKLGRVAFRLYGTSTAATREAVTHLNPEYVYGSVADRRRIGRTTVDQVIMKLAARDPNSSVVDAFNENPLREEIRLAPTKDTDAEIIREEPANTSVNEYQFARTLAVNDDQSQSTEGDTADADRTLAVPTGDHSTADIGVPAGYLHASELRARGWTRELLNEQLADDAVLIDNPPQNASPKIYPVDAVTRAEQGPQFLAAQKVQADLALVENEKAEALVVKVAAQIPRKDHSEYSLENSVGKKYLKARGWTDGHIDRLLGNPDAYTAGRGGESAPDAHLWGRERVIQAEEQDAKLQKRLASVADKKASVKSAEIAEVVDSGKTVFVRTGDRWNLRGKNLKQGQTVTVTTKGGQEVQQVITSITDTDADGVMTARSETPREPAPQRTPNNTAPHHEEREHKRKGPYIVDGNCMDCEYNEDTGDMMGCEWHRGRDKFNISGRGWTVDEYVE